MEKSRERFYSLAALLCGVWFLLTGWMWGYYVNLAISFPVGLLAFFFWYKVSQVNKRDKLNRVAFTILIAGIIISLGALVILSNYNYLITLF